MQTKKKKEEKKRSFIGKSIPENTKTDPARASSFAAKEVRRDVVDRRRKFCEHGGKC